MEASITKALHKTLSYIFPQNYTWFKGHSLIFMLEVALQQNETHPPSGDHLITGRYSCMMDVNSHYPS